MKILIVENDPEISSMVREGLNDVGYVTTVCRDGEQALRLVRTGQYSLFLLDLMLPSMDGITLCKRIRGECLTTPILMLTAKDTIAEKVAGLESGADDYLVKPFDFEELLARVRALLRRETVLKQSVLVIDDLVVDTKRKRVERAGKEIILTAREYTLLEAMVSRCGQVFTREAIQERIWLDEAAVSNVVDVTIKNLRKKIDDGAERRLIHTVYGLGYVLRLEGDT
jgi:two-component system copper resistance phosphate regulon response regulator CusR